MIETIYTELPFERINYEDRPGFYQEGEKEFKEALTQSMKKYGMKDPVYCWANGKAYGDIIKVIVGNNRMAVAKALGIKELLTMQRQVGFASLIERVIKVAHDN